MSFTQAQANWESSWVNGPPDDPSDRLDEMTDEQLLAIVHDEPDWESMSGTQARRVSAEYTETVRLVKDILRSRSYYR
jgi:hypothetical protein